jgi:hypothetical protein
LISFATFAFESRAFAKDSERNKKPRTLNESDGEKSNRRVISSKQNTTKSGKRILPVKSDNEIYADSSEALREGKKFSLMLQAAGFYGGLTHSIDAGYFLDPSLLVVGRIERSTYNIVAHQDSGYDTTLNSYGVYFKKFFGDSFYNNLGLFHRKIDSNLNGYWRTSERGVVVEETRSLHKATEQHVEYSIGNQWQFKWFAIGCDWVGLSVRLSRQEQESVVIVSKNQGPFEEDKTIPPSRESYSPDVRLLNFYLGVNF